MVPINKTMCPESKYPIKCPYTRVPRSIVVHNTGNNAPAKNEIAYMIRNNNEVSFHVAVDDTEIIEAIPFGRNAWASGDGRGDGNMYGIHIEICYSTSTDVSKFLKAEDNAAEYIAYLLKQYGWGIAQVKKHQDFDGKYCPHKTLDLGWDRFLKKIEAYLYPKEEEVVELSYEKFVEYMKRYEKERDAQEASSWAKEAFEKATNKGVVDGSRPRAPLSRQEFTLVVDRFGGFGD